MGELLQEIRVAQTGTQILFAFLLGVPFTQRFEQITSFQRTVYYATLLSAAVASVFLIAPSAYHRILFRQKERPFLIEAANRLTLVGLTFVALAMIGVIATTAIVGLFAIVWYIVPLSRRVRDS